MYRTVSTDYHKVRVEAKKSHSDGLNLGGRGTGGMGAGYERLLPGRDRNGHDLKVTS
jgi:hypothetical protein